MKQLMAGVSLLVALCGCGATTSTTASSSAPTTNCAGPMASFKQHMKFAAQDHQFGGDNLEAKELDSAMAVVNEHASCFPSKTQNLAKDWANGDVYKVEKDIGELNGG